MVSKENTKIEDFNDRTLKYGTSAYDDELNILYIINDTVFLEINVESKEITQHTVHHLDTDFTFLAVIDSKLHIFGATFHDKHIIWDRNTKKYSVMENNICDKHINTTYPVHSKSRKILLRLNYRDYSKQDYCNYSDSKFNWKLRTRNDLPASIRIEMIDNTQWMMIIDPECGGYPNIYMVDIDTWKIYKSKIKAPYQNRGYCEILGIDIDKNIKGQIVKGYILKHFGEECSIDLMESIVMYYSNIYVYIFIVDLSTHYKISLDSLLDGMTYLSPFWDD